MTGRAWWWVGGGWQQVEQVGLNSKRKGKGSGREGRKREEKKKEGKENEEKENKKKSTLINIDQQASLPQRGHHMNTKANYM